MKLVAYVAALPALFAWALPAPAGQTDCDPRGAAEFVCGFTGPEDLIRIPDSDWVIVAGMGGEPVRQGRLYAVDVRSRALSVIYPAEAAGQRLDEKLYGECPGPLAPGQFAGHGIDLLPGSNGVHRLFAVNHGARESMEIFEIDVSGAAPRLTWVGCVIYPPRTSGNGVVALPDGGFVTTHFHDPADKTAFQRMAKAEKTGDVREWRPGKGWTTLAGSELSGPNGIVISPDQRYLFVSGWPVKTLTRFARDGSEKQVMQLPFMPDNLRWASDGSILVTGHAIDMAKLFSCRPPDCYVTTVIGKIDPRKLTFSELIRYPGNEVFAGGTGAIEVGDELWVGSFQGERIARFQRK